MQLFPYRRAAGAVVATLCLTLASGIPVTSAAGLPRARAAAPVPGIDPQFIYDQLAFMATHFQRREAGYVAGSAGHTGFARYWSAEMLRLLGQYGATARRYPFKVQGWLRRPATEPAVNVEVTVPGVTQAANVVVIGCHYDGEALSTQSAYDDASGCAVELGVARAMARFWRSHGLYPARTLRFVIFDAEEQGVLGSFSYLNDAANATVPDISAMINEEQNGVGYPVRYLGDLARPLMTTTVYVSPAAPDSFYPALRLSAAQAARNQAFAGLLRQAVPGAFSAFRQLGYRELTYRARGGGQAWRPIFTAGQLGQVPVTKDTIGSSDQIPFTLAGIPDATIVGNDTYYSSNPPAGSYPYDRPQDTIGLMNAFADGGAGQSQALTMALGLPGMLTTWMLSQPGVLGQARPDGRPIAAIGSIGRVVPDHPVTFRASGFVPGAAGAKLRYSWSFGDGADAAGQVVRHAYAATGSFALRLTVSAPHRPPRTISEIVSAGQPARYRNPYTTPGNGPKPVLDGRPPVNPAVKLPVADPRLADQVGRRAPGIEPRPPSGSSSPSGWILAGVAVVVAAAAFTTVSRRRTRPRRARRAGR